MVKTVNTELHLPESCKEMVIEDTDPVAKLRQVVPKQTYFAVNRILDYQPEDDNEGFVEMVQCTVNSVIITMLEAIEECFVEEDAMWEFVKCNWQRMLKNICTAN